MQNQKMHMEGAPPSAPFLKENAEKKQNAATIHDNATQDEKVTASGKEIEIQIADTFFTRLAGLMFRKKLPAAAGLLLAPCNSVHMCFMRFAIDVIYLDKDYKILKIVNNLKPWIGLSMCSKAYATLEMTAGEADRCGLEVGEKLIRKDP